MDTSLVDYRDYIIKDDYGYLDIDENMFEEHDIMCELCGHIFTDTEMQNAVCNCPECGEKIDWHEYWC